MINLDLDDDVREHVLDFQGKIKSSKGLGKYSQQQAINTMLRQHKEQSVMIELLQAQLAEKAKLLPKRQ